MTPTQARRAMLMPRQTRSYRDCPGKGHYYVEDEGVTVVVDIRKGVEMVRLNWKQIEQALALKRTAETEVK